MPLDSRIEIDKQLATLRYRHLEMARPMIGTGGSSGEHYLQGAVNKNCIFAGVITSLIERCHLRPCHWGFIGVTVSLQRAFGKIGFGKSARSSPRLGRRSRDT